MSIRVYAIALILVIFILDQVSKLWMTNILIHHPPIALLPVFNLLYAENTGAAFGLFASDKGETPLLLTLFSALIIALLGFLLWTTKANVERFAFSFLLGGALGNLADRLRLGYVVDFIDLHWQQWHWPAFNVADMAITAGAILLFYFMIFSKEEKGTN